MTEDLQDTDDTPRLSASRDDRPMGAVHVPVRDVRRKQARSGPVLTEHPERGGGLSRPWLMLVAVLLAGLAYGWWDRQRQAEMDARLQAEVQAARDLAQRELELLRSSLSATGETLSAAEAQTGDRMSLLESEIRKLWDVSNKRNKAWISENQQALARLDKSLADASAAEKAAATQRAAMERKLASLEKSLAALRKDHQRLQAESTERTLALQTTIDQVSAQLGQITAGVQKLEKPLGDLRAESRSHADSIQSIDAFRRQTMQSLTTLQSAVSNLQRQVEQLRQPY